MCLSEALDALGVRHGVNIFNHYRIDAVVPQEVTGNANVALLLHPKQDFTSAHGMLGHVQLRARLLAKLGFAVVDLPHDGWEDLRDGFSEP